MDNKDLPKSFEEAFIKISFEEERDTASGENDTAYGPWVDHSSAKRSGSDVFAAAALRKLYPGHSVLLVYPYQANVLSFPGALVKPVNPDQLVLNALFIPLTRRSSPPGIVANNITYGAFHVAWDKYDFIVYVIQYLHPYLMTTHLVVHDGPEAHSRDLVLAAGLWANELHDEILVFDQGFWSKSHALWEEVQKADWKDVILEQDRKDAMHKDIYGFFKSEHVYRELSIPWKRGIIMYGPPGNGKTISIKAIMKECSDKGFSPLYVKSFQSWAGEEAAMQMVFNKARDMSPCVVIFEDLDTLINDRNRSYFLNQLDGFEGNDGILVIATTNHFSKLDPALSTRPSRFDRKYLFDDPTEDERILYAQYWQKKLSSNKSIDFPDSLVKEVAHETDKFSFAYLKEAFVSTLFLLATSEDNKERDFAVVLLDTIKKLREDLKKTPHDDQLGFTRTQRAPESSQPPSRPAYLAHPHSSANQAQDARADQFRLGQDSPVGPDGRPLFVNGRDMRSLAVAAAKLGRGYIF